ncbi:MAG TPA: protein kinase [Kofleriaceae bacterium]|nr:protein kinase [Kofleriaceae bacterium]
MKRKGDGAARESSSDSRLADALAAAAPDVTSAEEHRRRKELVRQRLLGDSPPATRIGRFLLLRQVGSGAMSAVYAAYDAELDRRVAVKLLHAPLAPRDERLRREAQAMARLSHPNVVAVHEIGRWEGQLFIAMELVKGQTLEAWRDAGRRTWQEIVEVLLQAGRGLAAAHALGLVHRDFKPANVMVGEDGRARVLDFGLVRVAEPAGARKKNGGGGGDGAALAAVSPANGGSLTATGARVGTPAYMAPEQRAGIAADARSDQFSFCVTLYEALFDLRPGSISAESRARRERRVPARLARAIDRGLADDPLARWPSMGHLLGELERQREAPRRWRVSAALFGMAALIAAVTLAAQHLMERQAAYQRVLAHDARLVVVAQQLSSRDPTAAAAALHEVRFPDRASGWRAAATAVLLEPLSRSVLRRPDAGGAGGAAIDRSEAQVLAVLWGGPVLIQRADGTGTPRWLPIDPGSNALSNAARDRVLTWRPNDPQVVLSRADGSVEQTLGEPGEPVAGAAFTGTGADVVTVSTEGVIRLWRSGGSTVQRTPPPELEIADPARWTFHMGPSGRHVLGRSPSGEHWLWRTQGTRPPLHVEMADSVRFRFSADERWLAVMFDEGDVELWSTEAGGSPRVLRGHEQTVADVDMSPDGRWLATASHDGTARVWPTDGPGEPVVLRGHTVALTSVRFDLEGRRVVTTSRDRTARVWSLDGSGDVMVLRCPAHHVTVAAFSPDGRTVVTYGLEPAVRLWDVSRRPVRILGRHDAEIRSASLDPAGRRLVTAGHDGAAKIFHLDGARPTIELRSHEERELYTALFSPDGRRVVTGGADDTARIWDADGAGMLRVLEGNYGWLYGMTFSPDGRWLATGSRDGEIRISPVDGPGATKVLERRSGHPLSVHALIFSPRGDRIVAEASGREGNTVLLLRPGGGRRRMLGSPRSDGRIVLARSPDGRIATGEQDGSIQVWSEDGEGPLPILRGHSAEIHSLAWTRDGRYLLSASFDGSARIWDLERPDEPKILRGHEDWVLGAAFDSDERRVVTASADGTARVWRRDEPDPPIVLRGHAADVRFAGFTPEGRVVTASADGTVRLWSLDEIAADVPALREQLRRATTACLTADQRMQHLEEPAPLAAARFAACEREAGRVP